MIPWLKNSWLRYWLYQNFEKNFLKILSIEIFAMVMFIHLYISWKNLSKNNQNTPMCSLVHHRPSLPHMGWLMRNKLSFLLPWLLMKEWIINTAWAINRVVRFDTIVFINTRNKARKQMPVNIPNGRRENHVEFCCHIIFLRY